jgi:hypothetical protein
MGAYPSLYTRKNGVDRTMAVIEGVRSRRQHNRIYIMFKVRKPEITRGLALLGRQVIS